MLTVRTSENTVITSFRLISERQDFSSVRTGENTVRARARIQEVYLLVDPKLDFQIHCVAYRMGSQYGSTDLPRYWITLGKETIFDYPKHFIHSEGPDENSRIAYEALSIYPYSSETSEISNMLREYIETPLSELMTKRSLGTHRQSSSRR